MQETWFTSVTESADLIATRFWKAEQKLIDIAFESQVSTIKERFPSVSFWDIRGGLKEVLMNEYGIEV